MSTPAEKREAQRAARKAKILENKNDRMSKVRGEYNQHRIHDSDEDEDKLSKLLGSGDTENYIVIEPANSGLRIVLFVGLAVLLTSLQLFNYIGDEVGLIYPYLCVQIALLTYMHTKSYLFRKDYIHGPGHDSRTTTTSPAAPSVRHTAEGASSWNSQHRDDVF
ncbi:hypothetical protein ACHWQZ_G016930 [Mnemiopsis leidyi]